MADINAVLTKDVTWLKQHETLLIAVFVLAAVLFLGNKWLDKSAQNADIKAALATQQLNEQKAVNQKLDDQVKQQSAQFQTMVDTYTKQNASLASAIVSRDNGLNQQQTANKTLPLPELAKRWETLTGQNGLTATSAGITADDAAARQTVNELEKVPVLTADLHDAQTVSQNTQQELGSAQQLIGGLTSQTTGLKAQIVDQDKACKADVAKVKAEARRSKSNWFFAGVVVGILGHLAMR